MTEMFSILCVVYGRQKNDTSKDVYILMSRTYEYVFLHGRRDSEDVIRSRTLRWEEYAGVPRWAQRNHKGAYKRRQEDQTQKSRCDDRSRVWGDVLC